MRKASRVNEGVVDWLLACPDKGFFTPVLPRGQRRQRLERWFDSGIRRLHCLTWEAETGLRMAVKDSFIAATALTHEMTVATRNVTDFEKAGCPVVNPFDA